MDIPVGLNLKSQLISQFPFSSLELTACVGPAFLALRFGGAWLDVCDIFGWRRWGLNPKEASKLFIRNPGEGVGFPYITRIHNSLCRWWFNASIFWNFHPGSYLGRFDPIWIVHYFSNGLVKNHQLELRKGEDSGIWYIGTCNLWCSLLFLVYQIVNCKDLIQGVLMYRNLHGIRRKSQTCIWSKKFCRWKVEADSGVDSDVGIPSSKLT